MIGRFLEPEDDEIGAPLPVVLKESLWKSRFGSGLQIVGKSIQLASRPYTVIGVASSQTAFPHNVDRWISLGRLADHQRRKRKK